MAGQTENLIAEVLHRIDTGQLLPGDEVDEAALMAALGISRTPMREAFLILETQGLLRRLPRKGAVVFKPTLEEFLTIQEVHASLEGQAAELAARRLSDSAGARLEQSTAACEDHAARLGDGDPDGYYQLNLRYHEAVAVASGNPFLVEMIKTNARKLMAYYRARYRYVGAIAQSAQDHRAITAAIQTRQSEVARDLMRRHVQFDQVTAMDLLAALS